MSAIHHSLRTVAFSAERHSESSVCPVRIFRAGLRQPRNTAMVQFAQMTLQVVLDCPVIDKTELAGRFNFEFIFTPDESQFNGHPPRLPPPTNTTNSSPGLFEAIQRQLGLRLTPETAPIDVLVIDHAEKPSAN